MTTQTITENGDAFDIHADCTDAVESCTCPTDGADLTREETTAGWTPRPAWADRRDQHAPGGDAA